MRSAALALEAGDTDLALRSLIGFGMIHDNRESDSVVRLHRLRTAWLERSLPALTGLKNIAAREDKEFPAHYLRRLVLAADAARDQPRALAFARVLRRVEPRVSGNLTPTGDNLAGAYEK